MDKPTSYSVNYYNDPSDQYIPKGLDEDEASNKFICLKAESFFYNLIKSVISDGDDFGLTIIKDLDKNKVKLSIKNELKEKLGEDFLLIIKNIHNNDNYSQYLSRVGFRNALVYFPNAKDDAPKLWIAECYFPNCFRISRPFFDSKNFPKESISFNEIKDEVELIVELLYQSTIEP